MIIADKKKLKDKDLFIVTSSGESGWISVLKSSTAEEACIESIKDLFLSEEKSLHLGLFLVSFNLTKLIENSTLSLKKKKTKFSNIFRSSEILADSNKHSLSKLFKIEEDNFLKKKKNI